MTLNTLSKNLSEKIREFPENIDTPNKFMLNKEKLIFNDENYNLFKQRHKVNYLLVYFLTASYFNTLCWPVHI